MCAIKHFRLIQRTRSKSFFHTKTMDYYYQSPPPLHACTQVYTTKKPDNKILLGSIDQGTTSTRFIVFDTVGKIIASHQREIKQYHPHAGWTEHDPIEILDSVTKSIEHTCTALQDNGFDLAWIESIGITNQRETIIAWDSGSGQPLHNAIVWHDTRPQPLIQSILNSYSPHQLEKFRSTTGLPMTTYFSGSKMQWMLNNIEAVKQANTRKTLRFGTVDAWLVYNLSGPSQVFATDFTNASRTMLMDLHTRQWSVEMMHLFNIPLWSLPTIYPSSHVYAHMHAGLLKGVPISGVLGDQQAALVGHKCFNVGDMKNTYGTGCFLLMNTGPTIPLETHPGLIVTAGYDIPQLGLPSYAIEGSVAAAGEAVKFLRDNLNIISEIDEINTLASQVQHTSGCYMVPAFSGLFAPHWNANARGTLIGLSSYTDKRHICLAVLESVGYQVNDLINLFPSTSQNVLRVDGGLTNSDLCMQVQASILNRQVYRPRMNELSAFGVAMTAALAVARITPDQVRLTSHTDLDVFKPQWPKDQRTSKLAMWDKAVERSLNWVSDNGKDSVLDKGDLFTN